MRIEKICFANLNSLAGEWVVDFTHPDYATEGLFAITGPTGAGKSTILDAICLALYGRTPRLGAVSGTNNEIMSRQTGQCRAEVTFSTKRGRYRCSWHQKRAHNKPDGTLQPIERRFVNADTGEVLEERVKKVNEAVEASTGMDFDRFTRSVMLAQGGFAAFLLSEPEQRSRILESLTGTAIYRDISIHVQSRYADEKRNLENLKSRLEGINLLSEEDEQRLQAEKDSTQQQQTLRAAELAEVDKQVLWLRGLEQLRTDCTQLEVQKVALLEQHTAFEPQRRVLRRAETAQALRPAFTELELAGKAHAETRANLDAGTIAMPALEQDVAAAEQQHLTAMQAATLARIAHESALPSLREAGKLDVLLKEKDSHIQNDTAALAAATSAHTALANAHEGHGKELTCLRETLEVLRCEMETRAADKALVESLAGLEERFAHVQRVYDQLQTGQQAEGKAHHSVELATKALAAQAERLKERQKAEAEAHTQLEARLAAIAQTLKGRELSVWRDELAAQQETQRQLLAAQEIQTRRVAASIRLGELQDAAKALHARQRTCTAAIATQDAQCKIHSEKLVALEKEANEVQIMATLAEHRTQLQDKHPCPLCGALQHPFAEGNAPASEHVVAQLNAAKDHCEHGRRQLEALRIQQIEDATVLKENNVRQSEQATLLAELDARLEQISVALASSLQSVAEQLRATETSVAAISALLAAADTHEKHLPGLRTALQAASGNTAQALLDHANFTQSLATAQNESVRLAAENSALSQSLQSLLHILEAEILPFGEAALTRELLDTVLNRLRTRRTQWQDLAARDVALQQRIAALDAQTTQQAARLVSEAQQLQTRRDQIENLCAQRCLQHQQRLIHFAGDDPAKEETRLFILSEYTEKARKLAESTLVAAQQTLAARQADLVRLRTELTERSAHFQSLQSAFATRLHDADFLDQSDFLAACLSGEVQMQLIAQARQLDDALTGLEATRVRLSTQLDSQLAAPLTTVALPELEAEQARLGAALTLLHHEAGALAQTLTANLEARTRHSSVLSGILQQQAVTSRWANLNALIGSADGKKYSNFAQGITFEIMLDHANRQLQAMRDRYLLVRDTSQPLSLNVMDSYQAGEVRTTANLSGGESFLVSLALALGLSCMASQNIRVDSLFLDEGFGSLDEDALETALGTISSLRSEGKLIGIISHVPAIKERVSTQVVVTPVAGGKSSLHGPGITTSL